MVFKDYKNYCEDANYFAPIGDSEKAWYSLNCILAGSWGPEKDAYRYYPMMASFAIHTPYARRYIQNGLKRARELQDETLAMMRENANAREHQQAGLWQKKLPPILGVPDQAAVSWLSGKITMRSSRFAAAYRSACRISSSSSSGYSCRSFSRSG
jgi:hypothetical protein